MRQSRPLVSSLVVLIAFLASPLAFAADQVPFRGQGEGGVTAAAPVAGGVALEVRTEGEATRLGRFTRIENLLLDGASQTFAGLVVFTAANGDTLSGTVQGGFVSPTSATGFYRFTGGTGRFQGATGVAAFTLTTPDGSRFTVQFGGTVSSSGNGK